MFVPFVLLFSGEYSVVDKSVASGLDGTEAGVPVRPTQPNDSDYISILDNLRELTNRSGAIAC